MPLKATTIDQYIAALPPDRQKAIAALRKTIKKNLPKGFNECMAYGMIGYVVPLNIYPAGYHANPKFPLGFMNLGSQKNFIVLHHLGVYGNDKLSKWFADEYAKLNIGKLDMGKGCIRFKDIEKIPHQLIGELCTKITVDQWIGWYEKAIKKIGKKK